MAKGKNKNLTNRNEGYLVPSGPSSPTTASPRYPKTHQNQELDLKLYLMILIKDFKKDLNNSLKRIQENICQQVKVLKEETQQSLKELQKTQTIK